MLYEKMLCKIIYGGYSDTVSVVKTLKGDSQRKLWHMKTTVSCIGRKLVYNVSLFCCKPFYWFASSPIILLLKLTSYNTSYCHFLQICQRTLN